MPIKHQDFIIRGMHRDMTESAFNPEYAYENQNLRITTDPNAEGTRTGEMYAMTNERGNKYVPIYGLDSTGHNADGQYGDMNGVPIGQTLLNNQWVVFMTDRDKEVFLNGTEKEIEDFPIEKTNIAWLKKTDTLDRIYRLWFNGDVLNGELLYEGHLNFSAAFPLETLPYFENSNIQKVYWTDGLNQPRMINIVEKPEKREHWNDYYFDFVSNIHFTHNVTIEESETGGRFPAGKIQWYFTYMMEFGPESNIFHSTPLYDIKFKDRGASPEEWTTQSFNIKLTNLDRQFDYVCIYSVLRTSIDNVPNCKLVAKLPINSDGTAMFVDTNLTGEAVEPQSLFYKGGETINAYTFENKDNTLFLGNYTIMRNVIDEPTRLSLRAYALKCDTDTAKGRCFKEVAQYPYSRFIYTDGVDAIGPSSNWFIGDWEDGVYNDLPNVEKFCTLTSKHLPYFKKGNIYRVGIQFQHYTGKWSEVIWLGDYKNYSATHNQHSGGWQGYYETRPLGYLKIDNQLQTIFDKLVSTGYRNVRPVIMYPNVSERGILCEGFVSNTLMTNKNETKNYPDYFVRSKYVSNLGNMPQFVGFSRFDADFGVLARSAMLYDKNTYAGVISDSSNYLRLFAVDNICDIYSPDVELNDSMQVYNYNGCNIKLKDALKINRVEYKRSLELSTINKSKIGYYDDDKFYFTSQQPFGYLGDENGYMYITGNFRWQGCFLFDAALPNYNKEKNEALEMMVPTENATLVDYDKFILFPVSLWQHSGSLSFDTEAEPYNCTLKSNKTLHYVTSYHTSTNQTFDVKPQDIQIWNGGLTGLKYNENVGLYDGWVNLICNGFKPGYVGYGDRPINGDAINWRSSDVQTRSSSDNVSTSSFITSLNSDSEKNDYSSDDSQSNYPTCDIKYRTVNHLCARFGSAFINDSTNTINISVSNSPMRIQLGNDEVPYIELVQDVAVDSIFGGYTEEVLQRNSFIPCGDVYSISEMYMEAMTDEPNAKLIEKYKAINLSTNPLELVWDTGDTYSYDYECLKTYPYTLEDENCVTEILKFPVETYINLGGRYDRNIGNPNFGTLPSNWNLINPIYNQTNNFMEYHGLDLSKNSVDDFHNSFTWTLTKWAGDETDRWTQITLANTMDVDGVRGGITKIINYGDMLMAFQPRGLSQILYNEREQLVTGSGVPVELSNSGKVAGTRYISNLAGCNNKWSICKTEQALYFVDDVNKQIMAFNGQLNNLSDNLGFHSWINVKANESIWNPLVFSNFISHFDPYNEDVMFYYKDNALSYSEQLQCFDSFFSYGYVPYYMAFHNSAFTLSDRDSDGKDTYKVWEQHKGYHNYFYVHDRTVYENGEVKLKGRLDNEDKPTYFGYEPYWTTLMVNPDMPYDKIFTNVDMRTDMWDWEGKLMEETFSHIEVWNEFQYNKSLLTKFTDIPKLHMPSKHSILKKKMRVWYIDIPRDSSDVQSHIWRGLKQNLPERNGLLCNRWKNRDRMRNTWLYLKLSKELYDEGLVEKTQWYEMPFRTDSKQVIHHIGVSYFI